MLNLRQLDINSLKTLVPEKAHFGNNYRTSSALVCETLNTDKTDWHKI